MVLQKPCFRGSSLQATPRFPVYKRQRLLGGKVVPWTCFITEER